MIKHLAWAFLLLGCHSAPKPSDIRKEPPSSHTTAPIQEVPKITSARKSKSLFNNRQPFEVVSFTNTIATFTTDDDTSKCNHWALTKSQIEKIIKNSEPIDGVVWDLGFLDLTCTKTVKVIQSGVDFDIIINGGSHFSINNGDTTLLFGDFKKSDRKYFIEGPNNE